MLITMNITLRRAEAADFDSLNGRCAAVGFVPSHMGRLIVIAESEGVVRGQGRVVPTAAVRQKHRWCNTTYDEAVLLLARASRSANRNHTISR